MLFILWLSVSCRFEDLGLNAEPIPDAEPQVLAADSDISNEDFFFQLKNKQKIQNPLADINIRKAILYAIDREEITETLMGEYNTPLNSLFNQSSPYYYPAWDIYSYDPELARQSLAKAGYSEEKPLYLTIGVGIENSCRNKVAQMIKEDLGEIGIYLWITDQASEDWYNNIVKNGEYEMGIWALYNYDGSQLESYFSSEKIPPLRTEQNKDCSNFYWYSSQDTDDILSKLSYAEDMPKKQELYRQLQEKLAADAVILPLFSRLYVVAHNQRIEGITINLENGSVLADMENWFIDSEEEETVVVGYGEEPASINPFTANTLMNRYLNEVLFNGLWSNNSSGGYDNKLVENYKLMENLQLNTANQMVNVQLKDNIYWEDGSPITSQDVYQTWLAVKDSGTAAANNLNYGIIENIEIIDDSKFNIVFNQLPEGWQGLFNILMPASDLEEYGQDLNQFENFTFANGPYKLAGWSRGNYILLEANEYFNGSQPGIKYIKFVFNSDINNLISALKAGDIDILSIPFDLDLVQEIEENDEINLIVERGNLWEHLAFSQKPKS